MQGKHEDVTNSPEDSRPASEALDSQAPHLVGRRPLVTFAVIAYNQSDFVREAIEAALRQDYSPLEVILSDDCSSDQTFEVMRFAAEVYRGPHAVVLRQNDRNLNIGGHINAVNAVASGELVVVAAGDDVSLPYRVSRLVEAWLVAGKRPGLLHSACRVVDAEGKVLWNRGCQRLDALRTLEAAVSENVHVIGATEAWDREMFNTFGDFRSDLVHEDVALTFRSLLAGRPVMYVDQPLVNYRLAAGITATYFDKSSKSSAARTALLKRLRADVQQRLDDLRVIPNPKMQELMEDSLARYDVAILFEQRMQSPLACIRLAKRVGLLFLIRMVIKRIVNRFRDRLHAD